jgi:hypothetical protein
MLILMLMGTLQKNHPCYTAIKWVVSLAVPPVLARRP